MKASRMAARVMGGCLGLLFIAIAGGVSAQVGSSYYGAYQYPSYGYYPYNYNTYYQPYPNYSYYQYPYNYSSPYYYYQPYARPSISITDPTEDDDFELNDTITIRWKTSSAPSGSDVQLDLYTASGARVGTITTESNKDKSYKWHISDDDEYCTLQYPNYHCDGLGGAYYIRGTLVGRGGYVLASDNSEVFTIERQGRDVYQFNAWPMSGYEPLRVTFSIVAEPGTYELQFDDGDSERVRIPAIYCFAAPCIPQVQYVTHTYRDTGTFDVTLEDSDNDTVGRVRVRVH